MDATESTRLPVALDVRGVAVLLGVSIRTVWRWTETGDLPAPARLGPARRTCRWSRREIERWLEARRDSAATSAEGKAVSA